MVTSLYKIFIIANSSHATPSSLVKVYPDWKLSVVRSVIEHPEKGCMAEDDVFAFPTDSQASSFVRVAKSDDTQITLGEYQQHLTDSLRGNIYISRSTSVAQVAEEPPSYPAAAADHAQGSSSLSGMTDDPIVVIPMVLFCWESKAIGLINGHPAVTSCLVTRLPADLMQNDASFSTFARSHVDGQRVALSLECPFHEESVLEAGIHAPNEVYAATIAAEHQASSCTQVGYDDWTHIAIVWNALGRTFGLYVNGRPSAVTALEKPDVVSFVKSIKEWRLVLGRGKSAGKMRDGWDGEITDVRVWNRALADEEIASLAKETPVPINPNLTKIFNGHRV